MAGDAERAERGAVTIGGLVAILALAALAVVAAVLLLGGDNGHKYKLLFETGGQLVPGNQVLVAGQPIGIIDELTLTDDAQAEVEVTLDEPLHEGTTAMVRSTSLSGIANRYISIHPGPNSEDEIPDGGTITTEDTVSPVDLDQLFNIFDKRTRTALQDVIQGQAGIYTGNYRAARQTYKYFTPSLQESQRLFAELNRDGEVLSRFLVSGSRVFGALAERRDDLSALTENANRGLGAIAREATALDRALTAFPQTMRQANTTFVNLRAALDDIDPLIADTKEVAPELAPFLRDLRPVTRASVPVIRDLRLAIGRDGANNDLTDSLVDLAPAQSSAQKAVPRTVRALEDSQHVIELWRAYSPDLLSLIGKLGASAGYYDLNGHYVRAQPAGTNVFDWNETTSELEPIPRGEEFDAFPAFGLGPFTRCPGGATQANVGWPAPSDHPFFDDGNLSGECDPADVPPGP